MQCYNCNTQIDIERKPHRQETCPKCMAYLHCCRNCRFYDPNAHNQCREPQAEWVKDKEMANFCDFFEPASEISSTDASKRDEARKKLNELFKKK